MKFLKLIQIFALLALCFTSVTAEIINEQSILHPKGLLWKIEKQGIKESYLYGTMHVSDERVTHLAPEVEAAFNQADHFVMEMLLNFKATGYVASASFFNNGQTLEDIMDHIEYKQLIALLKKRNYMSESMVRNMKPWAVLMILMMPLEQKMGSILDMQLYRRAIQEKMQVSGLESAKEQVDIFDGLEMQDQLWLLNQSVENIDLNDAQIPLMLNAYLQRDLQALVKIQESSMVDDSDVDDRFMLELLDKRNVRMVKRLQPILQQGNAFIAIGALHLPGATGVLALLEERGYVVSSIY